MPRTTVRPIILVAAVAAFATVASAQSPAAPRPSSEAAKTLFGAKPRPTEGPASAIGFYSRGCLAGGVELPIDGPHWQVMRLSRNRNWGHPNLIGMIEHLATRLPTVGGWPGILIGDMAQPRGGPMVTGHASHQIGLDVDIWVTPFPDHTLSREERDNMPPMNVVAEGGNDINPANWTRQHVALYKAASEEPSVERILVNPAVKKALCRDIHGDRSWLHKLRPYWGHDDHTHVRIVCPAGHGECRPQDPVPAGDGCDRSLDWWFTKAAHPAPPKQPVKPRPPLTLADLPPACAAVVNAP